MIKAVKVRLRPTEEQEKKLWQSSGTARYAYNWALARQEENYKNGGKFLDDQDLRKEFTQLKQDKDHEWLYSISNNVPKQAIKDACGAYKNFFEGKTEHPKYKSKRKSKPAFYNDYLKLKRKDDCLLLEKVGWVRISEPDRIKSDNFKNPRISFDGKYWYASIGQEVQEPTVTLTDETIGIDLGIKELAVCSNGQRFKNINKTPKSKKQSKKLRRLQRKVSRKYEMNKNGKEYVKTSNIVKLEKKIRHTHRKIANTRLNHIHQATTAIVKTKPSRIVMENLNVRGMMKNRHLSRAIGEMGFNMFLCMLAYKCIFYGIELVLADRFYPSSKLCSNCGHIKKDLKLKERVYKCPSCGNEIDRDYQASINLARYPNSA
jgi:putative transposase